MHLVNAHRRAEQSVFAAAFHPGVVRPLEFFVVPDDGGIFRRDLEEKSIGIGLQRNLSVRIADLKFVMRAFPHTGNENFPDAGRAEQPHRMKPPVPMIEIADDADALRIRRPNGKTDARNTVNHAQLRAELFVNTPLVALAEQEQIRFTQCRQKRKGVARPAHPTLTIGDDQVVGINAIGRLGNAFKQSGFVDALQLKLRLVLFVGGLDFNLCGIGQKGADDEARLVTERLHAQQRVR